MQVARKLGFFLNDKLNFKVKKTFTLGFFALAFFVFGLGFGKEASAATVYIDPTCANNGDGMGQGCAAGDGQLGAKNTWTGTAWVSGNVYSQKAGTSWTGQITVGASNITLNSYGIGSRPIIDANNANNFCIYAYQKNNLVIDGFELINPMSALYGPIAFDSVSSGSTVNNCYIHNVPRRGIYITTTVSDITITNNTIETSANDAEGLLVSSSENVISNNTITNNTTYKVSTMYGIRMSFGVNNNIHDNIIGTSQIDSYLTGISIESSNSNNVWNNTITGAWDGELYPSGNGIGIKVGFASAANNIHSNTISSCNRGYQDSTNSGNGENKFYYNKVINSIVNGIDLRSTTGANYQDVLNNVVVHHPLGSAGHGIVVQISGSRARVLNNIITCDINSNGNNIQSISIAGPYTDVLTNNNLYRQMNGCYYGALNSSNYDSLAGWQVALTGDSKITGKDSSSISANPLFANENGNNLTLQSTSPAIDSGTSVGLTSDYAGNPIYGTPDIGAYEYQPPHTIGTDKIDIAAGARIYGDGKFRDLSTTNSQLADLKITPQSESFQTYDSDEVRPQWLDIKNITWSNTKEWTESSDVSGLTNTLHEVGDLTPNKYFNISVDNVLGQNVTGDDCANGICKSDSNGKIAFTYTGTYSEHTFKVEAGDNTNPTLASNTNNKFSTDTTSVNLSLTTDENSTCHYSNNQNATFDDSLVFTNTGQTSHSSQLSNLTTGEYTYYAICRDSNNNESTYTLTFEIAPQELKENISSPIIKTSQWKEKMKSNNTLYSDEKEIKLQGEDIKLTNGTIKIYRNSKKIKTTQADENGKWNQKVKLNKDFSGYLKVKQYNQYGTLISEKKTKVKVDNQKPEITSFPKNQTLVTAGKTNLTFLATDNNKVTSYKIYLGGKIYKSKTNSFTIPAKTAKGLQYLRIKAYDKAGNSSYRETFVWVK